MPLVRLSIPAPLAALVATVLLFGVAWALLVPPGQSPDESSHVAYVQSIAEDLQRPLPETEDKETLFSSEQQLARERANVQETQGHLDVHPEWSREAAKAWEQEQAQLPGGARSDGGGPNPAAGNPPLYYAFEAIAYHAAGGNFFDRVFAMRLWSLLWMVMAVAGAWLLVGELTGRDRLLQLTGAAVVGLWPMSLYISASVNPDAAVNALWGLGLWLGVRIARRGLALGDVAGITAVTAAAVLVKPVGLALFPAVAFVLAAGLWRALRQPPIPKWAPWVVATALGLAALAVAVGASRVINPLTDTSFSARGFASYLWQFYLPHAGFLEVIQGLPPLSLWDIWLKMSWAAFGWLEVRFPRPIYIVFAALAFTWAAAGSYAIARRRLEIGRTALAFLGIAAGALLLGLHLAEYRALYVDHDIILQGRYLFPLLPVGAVWLVAALRLMRPERRPTVAALVLGGLFAFQLFSLGLVAQRFYA